MSKKSGPSEVLSDALMKLLDRQAVYGDDYSRLARVMCNMFPEGLTLRTREDWDRLHFLLMTVKKLVRYSINFHKGGHEDSVIDNIDYAAILLHLDREADLARTAPQSGRPNGTTDSTGHITGRPDF